MLYKEHWTHFKVDFKMETYVCGEQINKPDTASKYSCFSCVLKTSVKFRLCMWPQCMVGLYVIIIVHKLYIVYGQQK